MISNGGLQWTPICADCKNYETVNIFNVGSFSYGQTIVFFECICDLPFTNEEEYMEQWSFKPYYKLFAIGNGTQIPNTERLFLLYISAS